MAFKNSSKIMIEAKQKRNPCCSRCKNHGHQVPMRGHLKKCPYEFCNCEKCQCTQARRIALNKDINQRRSEARAERMLIRRVNCNESFNREIQISDEINFLNELNFMMERKCKSFVHELITKFGENSLKMFEDWLKSGKTLLQNYETHKNREAENSLQACDFSQEFQQIQPKTFEPINFDNNSPQSVLHDSNYQLFDLDLNQSFSFIEKSENSSVMNKSLNSKDSMMIQNPDQFGYAVSENDREILELDFSEFKSMNFSSEDFKEVENILSELVN